MGQGGGGALAYGLREAEGGCEAGVGALGQWVIFCLTGRRAN